MEATYLPTNNDDDNEQTSINLLLLADAARALSDAFSAEDYAKYSLDAIKEYTDMANVRLQTSYNETSTALVSFRRAYNRVKRSMNHDEERERAQGRGESTEGKVVVSIISTIAVL